MSIYKQASKEGLRFSTTKGNLSVEQLWSLTQTDLGNSLKTVKKILKKSDDEDLGFLDEGTTVDKENQLRFDILKDIYLTKKAENEARRTEAERKENNQKIMALIQRKKEDELGGKSIAELEAMLS